MRGCPERDIPSLCVLGWGWEMLGNSSAAAAVVVAAAVTSLGTGGDSVLVGTRYWWGLPGLQDFARTTRLCQDYKSLPGLQDLQIPKFHIPKLQIPKLQIPKFHIPKLQIPKLQIPKFHIPKLHPNPLKSSQIH